MTTTFAKQLFSTVTATKIDTHGAQPSMTVSTATVDRDGDRVLPEGGDFRNFLHNPVLCWAHQREELPVGTVTGVSADSSGIRMQWRWLENDPFADRVRNAYEQGVVRAASIGFLPRQSQRNEFGGEDHRAWELCEISLVPVPANPQAVRTLKSLGLWDDRDSTIDWAAINGASKSEIDWDRIELPSAEVNVSTDDVNRVLSAFAPALQAGVVSGLRVMARQAATSAINRMTGRLD